MDGDAINSEGANIPAPEDTGSKTHGTLKSLIFPIIIFFLLIISGVLAFFLTPQTKSTQSNNGVFPKASPAVSITTHPHILGKSTVSFTDTGNEVYIKHTITIYDNKLQDISHQNSNLKTINTIYPEQKYSMDELEEIPLDANKYTWEELDNRDIADEPDQQQVFATDRLFSFMKVPASNNFLFVMDWDKDGRVLYFVQNNVLKQIKTFYQDRNEYTYPKIESFSKDGRYVSLRLFRCWGCDGHQWETMLIDLQTLQTKNIGKVLDFTWNENGAYEYKDYIVIPCKELTPGECSQDPSTLPLKTGSM